MLRLTREDVPGTDTLAGGRHLDDVPLVRRLRPRRASGRAVERAWAFDLRDEFDPRWWPQGVAPDPSGRRRVTVTWYAKELPWDGGRQGARLTLIDLDAERYQHVLLVVPDEDAFAPLRIHAGGLAWCGPWLHVAATARGIVSFHVDDVARVRMFGYDHVWPARIRFRGRADGDLERLRYSFLGTGDDRSLVVGEYARVERATRRLAVVPLEEHLPAGDPVVVGDGVGRTQGAAVVDGRWYLTSSRGRLVRSSLFTGAPGSWREHRAALPPGIEDVAWWPAGRSLLSLSEHPGRRRLVAFSLPR